MWALTRTDLSVVTWSDPINDAVAEWGQLLAYMTEILRLIDSHGNSVVLLPMTHGQPSASRSIAMGRSIASPRYWTPRSAGPAAGITAGTSMSARRRGLRVHALEYQGSVMSRNFGSPSEIAWYSRMYCSNSGASDVSFSLARASASDVK